METLLAVMGKINTYKDYSCSSDCKTIAKGYSCATPGSLCKTVCGDGYYISGESCDDGNLTNSDGCSSTCSVESGWYCAPHNGISKDTCSTKCGDGIKAGTEACDDGNTTAGDG